eukprot:15460770-Alexandrium_andersonii.AAC.1
MHTQTETTATTKTATETDRQASTQRQTGRHSRTDERGWRGGGRQGLQGCAVMRSELFETG